MGRVAAVCVLIVLTGIVVPGLVAAPAGATHGPEVVGVALTVSVDAGPLAVDGLDLHVPASAVYEHGLLAVDVDGLGVDAFDTEGTTIDAPGMPLDDVEIVVGLSFAHDLIGVIDEERGDVTLVGAPLLHLSVPGRFGDCVVGPLEVDPDNRHGDDVEPYDPDVATATVVDTRFFVPAVEDGTAGCDGHEAEVDASLGLPRPPNSSTLTIELALTDPPPPAGGSDGGGSDGGGSDGGGSDGDASDGIVAGPTPPDTGTPSGIGTVASPATTSPATTTTDAGSPAVGAPTPTSATTASTSGGAGKSGDVLVKSAHARRTGAAAGEDAGGRSTAAAEPDGSQTSPGSTVWRLDDSVVVGLEPERDGPLTFGEDDTQRALASPVSSTPSDKTAQRVVILLGSALVIAVAFRLLRSEALASAARRRARGRPRPWI